MSRYCGQCGKALKACICQWIKTIPSNTELIILQHPSESKRPLGTAKILQLSLPNCRLLVGEVFDATKTIGADPSNSDMDTWVLYPDDKAVELPQAVIGCLNQNRKHSTRLIVIDGTWKKAYKMWQLNPWLHQFTSVTLPNTIKGNYRIRKAPSDSHLSTVEAGYYALQLLEPETDFSPILSAFQAMIEQQIRQLPDGVYEKNYNKQ